MDAGDLIYIFFIFVITAQPAPLGAAFVTKVLQVSAIYDRLYLKVKKHIALVMNIWTSSFCTIVQQSVRMPVQLLF